MKKMQKYIQPFSNFWCHKILPLVYDDSLSYYEMLCKLKAKMNEIIDAFNELDIEPLIEKYISQILLNAMYIEATETIVITKDKIVSEDDVHTYVYATNTMEIGEDNE